MSDREIYTELVELMQHALEREEANLREVKMIYTKLASQAAQLAALLNLVRLPESPARAAALGDLVRQVADSGDLSEAFRDLARHESWHERRAGALARLRSKFGLL